MTNSPDVLTDRPGTIFFRYAIPTIVGMLAISSASVVDGIFVGNFIGARALAAVNLTTPFLNITFGLALMLSVGGSVQCGRFLGENRGEQASGIFSQIISMAILLSILVSLPVLVFPKVIVGLLGANEIIESDVMIYLGSYCWFLPLVFLGICLTGFVRTNQKPGLVSFALVFSAVLNLFLDWLFIVHFKLGLRGAAVASGLSQSLVFFILFFSFLGRESLLHFTRPGPDMALALKSVFNGISEFVNETSGGLIILSFNVVLMRKSGVDAVAAFAVINYVFYLWLMVAYSAGEAIQAPTSINFGAGQMQRAVSFFKSALFFNLTLGMLIVVVLLLRPEFVMGIFLADNEMEAKHLVKEFLPLVFPAFLFSGVNIAASAFFTALQKAGKSLCIALLRALILPIGFVFIISYLFNFHLIFLAIPLAELMTFCVAWGMFMTVKKEML